MEVDDVLAHYGVKGMKWGHHKYAAPSWNLKINEYITVANTIARIKFNEVAFPVIPNLDFFKSITTFIGQGLIDKAALNLSSQMCKATLLYEHIPYSTTTTTSAPVFELVLLL